MLPSHRMPINIASRDTTSRHRSTTTSFFPNHASETCSTLLPPRPQNTIYHEPESFQCSSCYGMQSDISKVCVSAMAESVRAHPKTRPSAYGFFGSRSKKKPDVDPIYACVVGFSIHCHRFLLQQSCRHGSIRFICQLWRYSLTRIRR